MTDHSKTTAVLEGHGVPAELRTAVLRAYEEFSEGAEDDDVARWRLGPDDYYDLLGSLAIGHRRIKTWLHEPKAGASVTLTTKGRSLFAALAAMEKTNVR